METQHGLPAVTCRDLRKIQETGKKHVLIDVRDEADYEAGHIEGSVHVPLRELEGNIEGASKVELLSTGVLNGDLKAGSLTVASGSRMRGNVSFGWDEVVAPKQRLRMETDTAS